MAGTTVRRQRYARRGARPPARLHLGVGQRSGIRAGSRPSSGKLARSRLTGSFIPPRTAARVAYGSPAQPVPLQGGEIGCPQGIAVLADLAQVAPGVDAGIVQVVEYDPDGVVALRDQFHDPDMAAPGHDPLLSLGNGGGARVPGSFTPPRTAGGVAYGSPAQPVPLQGGGIGCPQGIAVLADLAQVAPGVDAGIGQVVEYDPDGVVALRDQFHDPDMAAPGHDPLLSRPVSHHLGGRTFDTKEFGRGGEGASVVEVDFQQLLRRFQTDLHRPAVGATRPVHVAASGAGSSRYRASSISMRSEEHTSELQSL